MKIPLLPLLALLLIPPACEAAPKDGGVVRVGFVSPSPSFRAFLLRFATRNGLTGA